MSVMNVISALLVELFDLPPNWLGGMRLRLPARKVSQLATMRSSTLARHLRSVMRW